MTEARNKLSGSLEDYVETIFLLQRQNLTARSKDIAERLDVRRASVTGALRALAKKGLVNYAPYESVTLTEKGNDVAREVLKRHNTIKRFLNEVLGFDETTAETDACKMEHALSREVRERLKVFMDFVDLCPRTGPDWLSGFRHFYRDGDFRQNCAECVEACLVALK
jgi:DtxR family Mn-dependent transcriptional regulator